MFLYNLTEFTNHIVVVIVLFILFNVSVAAMTYCFTYFFNKYSTSQPFILLFNITMAIIVLILFFLNFLKSVCRISIVVEYIYYYY